MQAKITVRCDPCGATSRGSYRLGNEQASWARAVDKLKFAADAHCSCAILVPFTVLFEPNPREIRQNLHEAATPGTVFVQADTLRRDGSEEQGS